MNVPCYITAATNPIKVQSPQLQSTSPPVITDPRLEKNAFLDPTQKNLDPDLKIHLI